MYVQRNIQARLCNHCCSSKTISIIQCECVCSLRYPAYNAHAPYCIVICGLPRSTILVHIIPLTARFSEKKKLLDTKCGF